MSATIETFLSEYEVGADRRSLNSAERQLLRDALTDYLCHEQWLDPHTPDAGLVAALRRTAADPDIARIPMASATLKAAAATIADLAARLDRREHANLILREQLAVVSDALRVRRAGDTASAAPDLSDPQQEMLHGPRQTRPA